jgi:hypothetical protein
MDVLKTVLRDICAGYSSFQYKGSEVFIKHITQQDSYLVDSEYDKYYALAAGHNIPTRQEKLEQLERDGEWTKKNERELKEHDDYLKNLQLTLSKLAIESQRKSIKVQIEEAQKRTNDILYKKLSLLRVTCDKYAEDKTNQYYIYYSLFKDDLKNRYFTFDDFEELEDNELIDLSVLYSQGIGHISIPNIKKLSVHDVFTSKYYLCGDNVHLYFNKPILDLTYNQVLLLNYGNYYKKLLINNDVPNELLSEPDKIEEYVQTSRNTKQIIDKNQNENVGIMANRKDMEKVTGKQAPNPLLAKLSKEGRIKGTEAAIKAIK